MTGFFTAPRIAWGPGAVEQLSGLGARRACVVVDAAVATQHGHQRVIEELGKSGTAVEVIEAGADADRVDVVTSLAARMNGFGPDWVVAVGGGRTIDAAKAARLLLEKPELSLDGLTPVFELPEPPRCRLVAVPTTSGSGSEASWTVDLRLRDEDRPVEIAHRALVPDWAVVDVGFAGTLSNELRRDGGLEALGQAVEAYLSAWANPFSDALALSVVRTVFERLPHALKWSDDPDAKEAVHFAATLAGLAASNAQRGLTHALARALEPRSSLSYGQLLGILLPRVLEFDRPSARERIEALALVVHTAEDRAPVPFEVRLVRLFEAVRAPASLDAAGIDRARIEAARDRIVADTLRSPGVLANPRVPGERDIDSLLTGGTAHSPSDG
ncbi:MAG TPA: iron-containing alcohol dehydrogenase [Thermoplasmata archaeon]|nr:iron-containing alcohol dehydrogenase [Thermoplasmata archaeon]